MTTKKFLIVFLSISATIVLFHALLSINFFSYSLDKLILFDGIVVALFGLASLMIVPLINSDKESFVMRFMVLTTVQFLGGLILLTSIIFSKIDDFRMIAIHTILIFILILFIQSILLLSLLRK